MRYSESWLREWVNPSLTLAELSDKLTMAGLEVESIFPASERFAQVRIGEIVSFKVHPEAKNLKVCQIKIGENTPLLQIVCGASNVDNNLKVAVAEIGATLPNQKNIESTLIRGVMSAGMLCSACELGFGEKNEGIFVLASDAPIGSSLWDYLNLEDNIIDVSITPNRGDCLSIKGLAREVSSLTGVALKENIIPIIPAAIPDIVSVQVNEPAACPNYIGRIIKNIKLGSQTPVWLSERLRRSGIRSINPIVDVVNYVMLEQGQPMHAFNLDTIQQNIQVRLSKNSECIVLLDGSKKNLDANTVIIADASQPLAIAGVMGGINSSVTLETQHIFLESAYFSPTIVAKQRQYYGLNSDSAYRYERGIDPTIQSQAMERATQLILEITGGEAGQVIDVSHPKYLPKASEIFITPAQINQLLGTLITQQEIEKILQLLKVTFLWQNNGWQVKAPSYRPDLVIAEDLIEEIARIYGYDRIPEHAMTSSLTIKHAIAIEDDNDYSHFRTFFRNRSYHEIISYSFIDKKLQSLFDPHKKPRELVNPISTDMALMRTNLWPGLIKCYLYNKSRQQQRIRLFEIGTCFTTDQAQLIETAHLGGLIAGAVLPLQWGVATREGDFFDLKGDIEDLLKLIAPNKPSAFKQVVHPALHPGQSANIYIEDQNVGLIGTLHPWVMQTLQITEKIVLIDLNLLSLMKKPLYTSYDISKFPEIRRDLALIVNEAIPAKDIQDTIRLIAGNWLMDIFTFDVYQGKGVAAGHKSIAFALILQHPTRTLLDEDVTELIDRVTMGLKDQFGAELRR